jgi:Phosphate-selective porin O and P
MNKIVLSAITAMTLGSVGANAIELYQDANGQVFTSPAEGRTALGNYVNSETQSQEKKSNGISIIKKDSPEFPLGKETHINMKFVPEDAPDMWFKAGVRIQGTMESKNTDYNDVTKTDTTISDAYLRRVRLEVAAGFGEHSSFVMDIRNDKSNYGLENEEGNFNVGDAYVKIKKPFNTSLVNFKLYRAKIDVSRTETVKSARVIAYDRPYVADAAAQYISFNRRGANVQMYGDWNKKIHYQIAAGAAANPSKVKDATGASGSAIELTDQSFFFGGKVKLSPFDGWEEKIVTETYMGQGKHFTVGASYWAIPTMEGKVTGTNAPLNVNRSLVNAEISGHYKGFMAQAEYFKFDDVIEDNAAATLNLGTSSGWYATSEYVFTDFHYIAPFVRYESWDKFEGKDGYDSTSMIAGLNWYLRGNTTKVGMYYQKDELGLNTGNKDVNIFRVTSQWFF